MQVSKGKIIGGQMRILRSVLYGQLNNPDLTPIIDADETSNVFPDLDHLADELRRNHHI